MLESNNQNTYIFIKNLRPAGYNQLSMIPNFLDIIKGERIDPKDSSIAHFFHQQQKAYSFCQKYVRNKTVLEIGSGSGYGTHTLSKSAKKITAIDKDFALIKKSNKLYHAKNIMFINSSIQQYQTKQKFDIIIMLQVIEHILDVHPFLIKIISLLKKDGVLILSTPNATTQSFNENPYHFKEYNLKELQNLLVCYFAKIKLHGLFGDKKIQQYESLRKKQVLALFEKDSLNIRRFVPRIIKQHVFDVFSFSRKWITKLKSNPKNNVFSQQNFTISSKNMNKAIDLIAVCYK